MLYLFNVLALFFAFPGFVMESLSNEVLHDRGLIVDKKFEQLILRIGEFAVPDKEQRVLLRHFNNSVGYPSFASRNWALHYASSYEDADKQHLITSIVSRDEMLANLVYSYSSSEEESDGAQLEELIDFASTFGYPSSSTVSHLLSYSRCYLNNQSIYFLLQQIPITDPNTDDKFFALIEHRWPFNDLTDVQRLHRLRNFNKEHGYPSLNVVDNALHYAAAINDQVLWDIVDNHVKDLEQSRESAGKPQYRSGKHMLIWNAQKEKINKK